MDADNSEDQSQQHEWSAFYKDGNLYYYNEKSGESSWEAPDQFNPPPETNEEAAAEETDVPETAEGEAATSQEPKWIAYKDDDGQQYFVNTETDETTWEEPESFQVADEEAEGGGEEEQAGGEDEEQGAISPPRAASPIDQPPEDEQPDDNQANDDAMEVEAPKGQWVAYTDEEGREYFFNTETNETTWEKPDSYQAADAEEGDQADASPIRAASPGGDEQDADSEAQGDGVDAGVQRGQWVAYTDEEGREYFFNVETNETTWEKPDSFQDAEGEEGDQSARSPERARSPGQDEQPADSDVEDANVEVAAEVEPVPVVDPTELRLKQAEDALNTPDAIMEKGVMLNVTEVVASHDGKPQKAIQALIDSYDGQTAVCGLLGRWLADLKADSSINSSKSGIIDTSTSATDIANVVTAADQKSRSQAFENTTDGIRQKTQEVICKIVKERFNKNIGDGILNLSRSEAAFLEDMMDSPRWRKLLIDLSATNKDSTLLMYCLQSISKRGHHREIAKRINQSDHFSVFNAMLSSELSVVGKIAITSCKDNDASIGLTELVNNLRRTCTSTAYTYIYAIEVLGHLVQSAKISKLASDSRFRRVIHKWQRLSEELQASMVDPNAAGATSSTLFRKRRLDVAIVVNPLHQRQRRRLNPEASEDETQQPDDGFLSKIETAVLNVLRKYSFGTAIDERAIYPLLPADLENTDSDASDNRREVLGRVLISHPMIVQGLIGSLFKPGSQRISSQLTRTKCATLIALAMVESERLEGCESTSPLPPPTTTISDDDDGDKIEENAKRNVIEAHAKVIVEASQLCESLESMVSFFVSKRKNDSIDSSGSSSPGQRLCSLAFKSAAVAQGVCMWARQITKGAEFITSASYPTLSPSILSLIRIISMEHPFTYDETTDIAFSFLGHANSDVSYQKMNAIKEQSLRLLLIMCFKGDPIHVLDRMSMLLQTAGNTSMDAALIRYFISGLLQLIKAPYSVPFVRCLCRLLRSKGCLASVRTEYFDAGNKKTLDELVLHIQAMAKQQKLSKDDRSLIGSVAAIYAA